MKYTNAVVTGSNTEVRHSIGGDQVFRADHFVVLPDLVERLLRNPHIGCFALYGDDR